MTMKNYKHFVYNFLWNRNNRKQIAEWYHICIHLWRPYQNTISITYTVTVVEPFFLMNGKNSLGIINVCYS